MAQRSLPFAVLIAALLIVFAAYAPALSQEPETQDSQATLSTAFTYQGRIDDSDGPVNGTCDVRFTLHDDDSADSPVGATLTKTDVPVNEGLFTVSLNFGPSSTGQRCIWRSRYAAPPAAAATKRSLHVRLSPQLRMHSTVIAHPGPASQACRPASPTA